MRACAQTQERWPLGWPALAEGMVLAKRSSLPQEDPPPQPQVTQPEEPTRPEAHPLGPAQRRPVRPPSVSAVPRGPLPASILGWRPAASPLPLELIQQREGCWGRPQAPRRRSRRRGEHLLICLRICVAELRGLERRSWQRPSLLTKCRMPAAGSMRQQADVPRGSRSPVAHHLRWRPGQVELTRSADPPATDV